jgi:hypothetical protein
VLSLRDNLSSAQRLPCYSGFPITPKTKKEFPLLFGHGTMLNVPMRGPHMIDPSSRLGRELKAAEDFLDGQKR